MWRAELDVDLRWAGEPDIVLKLEPTNKWVMNALRLGARRPLPLSTSTVAALFTTFLDPCEDAAPPATSLGPPARSAVRGVSPCVTVCACSAGKLKVLPAVDITPTMTCQVRMIQISAILRVSLAPVLPDLPFVGAVSLSLMTPPYLDFDLRRGTRGRQGRCTAVAARAGFWWHAAAAWFATLWGSALRQGLGS